MQGRSAAGLDHGGAAVRPRAAGTGLPYEREGAGRPVEVAAQQLPQRRVRGRVGGPVGRTREGGRAPELGGAESGGWEAVPSPGGRGVWLGPEGWGAWLGPEGQGVWWSAGGRPGSGGRTSQTST
ncbi:hypothetical protein Smic_43680 [Streptomyces microflavus]|uniref:Uncharacterized protein n=1 Tax=Streptomyces microflavus TaxID=1919 RepID=A0A7J0CTR1_STRMI|nr:hypothetical protein Smic_43680 [Streptomyces microflavus]